MDQHEGRDPGRVDQVDQAGLDHNLADPEVAGQDPAADRVDLRVSDDLDVARASRP
jgi:hypothetical protein